MEEENKPEAQAEEEAKPETEEAAEGAATEPKTENDAKEEEQTKVDSENQPKEGTSEEKSQDTSNKKSVLDESAALQYAAILNEIKKQNGMLNDLKQRLTEVENKRPNACTESEIRGIRCCLEMQKEKIRCLVQRVMRFQKEHPGGPWDEIDIETNLSEDQMSGARNNTVCTAICNRAKASDAKVSACNRMDKDS